MSLRQLKMFSISFPSSSYIEQVCFQFACDRESHNAFASLTFPENPLEPSDVQIRLSEDEDIQRAAR